MGVNKSKRINKKNNQLDLEMPKLKLKPYTIIGKRAFITGYAIDNDGIAELSIDNKALFLTMKVILSTLFSFHQKVFH